MPKPRAVSFQQSPDSDRTSDIATKAISDAIQRMLDGLPPEQREAVLQHLKLSAAGLGRRPGTLANTVVRLMPKDSPFTVDSIKKKAADEGVNATSKEIYNAFGYLTRKRQIRRLGYGRYLVDGVAVVTSDDLGGEPGPHDCE